MPWHPRYTITDNLLQTIRLIGETIGRLKSVKISGKDMVLLEVQARALSSFSSTRIEGNPLSLTRVKELLKNQPAHLKNTEREITNYNQALQWIYEAVKAGKFLLSTDTIQKVQAMVVNGLLDNPADIGAFRQHPVVIHDPKQPDSIVFMPPNYQDVQALMAELVAFMNSQQGKIDALILAGLFHRQFVIVHPFIDGNGRTVRLLTTALLAQTGLNVFELFSFENYYNQNMTRYFEKVGLRGDYYDLKDHIDFTEWLEYFAAGILDELRRVEKTLP